MIDLIRRLLGIDRFEKITTEQRDRDDALRAVRRADEISSRLAKIRRDELQLRVEVKTRR